MVLVIGMVTACPQYGKIKSLLTFTPTLRLKARLACHLENRSQAGWLEPVSLEPAPREEV